MTPPTVPKLEEELTEVSTLRLHVKVGGGCHATVKMWKPRSDNEPECCFGADWELLASRLPKKGGKEGAPRHVMAGDLRVTTKVGKDPGNGIRNEEAEATVKRYVVPYRQKIQSRPSSGLGGKTSKMWGSRVQAKGASCLPKSEFHCHDLASKGGGGEKSPMYWSMHAIKESSSSELWSADTAW
ncbi:hypothetical protein V6N12_073331 [Hibiscus sabdariffa]|uniref:Uncharacterized protein n=1 Tax=Hibiscus sabdariffa TaxID=183260 RepID=A0ABR2AP25_9ROSI